MPVVQIQMVAGRSAEKKRALITQVTIAVATALEVTPGMVRVMLIEIAPEHYAVGGVTKAESAGPADGSVAAG